MNTKLTTIAIALIATSAAAFAADAPESGKTRAEVRAEVEKAYAEGQLGRPEFVEYAGLVTTAPRAAVRADLERARAAQPVASGSQEFVDHAPVATGKTRAEVRAEVEQAYADGTLGNSPEFVEHTRVAAGKSREEVRDEAIRAAKVRSTQIDQSGS